MNTPASKARIHVIQRSTTTWKTFPLFDQTKRKISGLLAKGKTPDEIIKANKDVKGFSKANVYKLVEQLKEPKEEKKDAVNKQDTNGNAEDVF